MKVSGSMYGAEFSFEFQLFEELVKGGLALTTGLYRKLKDRREQKQIEELFECRQFLHGELRKIAAQVAASYYTKKGFQVLDLHAPLLYREEWMPQEPIPLTEVKLSPLESAKFTFDGSIYAQAKILPLKNIRYSVVQKSFVRNVRIGDDEVYRLIRMDLSDGSCRFAFSRDAYSKYIDTCELIAFELCREMWRSMKESGNLSELDPNMLKLRSQAEPFDFENRTAGVGINTILIFTEQNGRCSFYMHDRSKAKVAEAIGTWHVVPAGSFAPRHKGHVYEDYSFYTNTMREFGEELLGREELEEQVQDYSSVFEVDVIKGYSRLVDRGLGKAYYLGMGLDCLTTKPEILTALVFDRKDVEVFLGGCKLIDNYEGEHVEVDFDESELDKYIRDERTLPAGAGCLLLVKRKFEFLKKCPHL